jgi:hypothetical protein
MLLFDIETVARPEALSALPDPTAPTTYKDPTKIAEYVERKRADQFAAAALDPDTARVVSIAWRDAEKRDAEIEVYAINVNGDDVTKLRVPAGARATIYPDNERDFEGEILKRFWNALTEHRGCSTGYNILGFDYPFMLRRSMALGVRPDILPRLARYQDAPTRDLYALLYNWQPGKGLKTVCELYGIENPLARFDGGDFANMSLQERVDYAVNDVRLTRELYLRMSGVYWAREDAEFPF